MRVRVCVCVYRFFLFVMSNLYTQTPSEDSTHPPFFRVASTLVVEGAWVEDGRVCGCDRCGG